MEEYSVLAIAKDFAKSYCTESLENIKNTNDPRHKVAKYVEGRLKEAAKVELLFFQECKKRGINIEIPYSRAIDFKVNGFWVDVKSCHTPYVSWYFQYFKFAVSKKQMKRAKYIACCCGNEKSFYIIPTETITNGGCISISESTLHKAQYGKYKDAWHLLENADKYVL